MIMSFNGKLIPLSASVSRFVQQTDSGAGLPAHSGRADQVENNAAATTTVERFQARVPRHCLTDLVLSEATRRRYATLLSRIRNHDLLYQEWGLARIDPGGQHTAVCFYGPPGTGKTMCAEALAAELGQPIIEVDYAEIESKYVGETPKNIVAAFRAASQAGALLFFDEADSILGRRMTHVTQAADQAVNVSRAVMLKQLDQFTGTVAFATNLARNFDRAFVRRILMHIKVPLPDAECRPRLWQRMLDLTVPGLDQINRGELAAASDGLAGGDIKNAVIAALAAAADRTDPDRCLRQDDLLEAIADVRRSKTEVGFDGDEVF
jgi:SpoVK/Ycf46/Vps4 family AAA+-type ATPase